MEKTEIKKEHIDKVKKLLKNNSIEDKLIRDLVIHLFYFISLRIHHNSNIPVRIWGFGIFIKKSNKMNVLKKIKAVIDAATQQPLYNPKDLEVLLEERKEICKGCPLLLDRSDILIGNDAYICDDQKEYEGIKGCGCSLAIKWKAPTATCPRKLWENLEIEIITSKKDKK